MGDGAGHRILDFIFCPGDWISRNFWLCHSEYSDDNFTMSSRRDAWRNAVIKLFLRIAGAHCAEQFGIIGVKRLFDPNIILLKKDFISRKTYGIISKNDYYVKAFMVSNQFVFINL